MLLVVISINVDRLLVAGLEDLVAIVAFVGALDLQVLVFDVVKDGDDGGLANQAFRLSRERICRGQSLQDFDPFRATQSLVVGGNSGNLGR